MRRAVKLPRAARVIEVIEPEPDPGMSWRTFISITALGLIVGGAAVTVTSVLLVLLWA